MAQGLDISAELTRQLARLARLELSEVEVQEFTPQLQAVLGYVSLLQKVEVGGVEPMTHPGDLITPMREDQVRPSLRDLMGEPKVLSSAPEVIDGGFKVPPIL